MLEASECNFIQSYGWILDHDWEVLSCLLGEPFLLDDFLCFWDNDHLTICAWPVQRPTSSANTRMRLLEVAREYIQRFAPKLVEVWGPENIALDPVLPSDFKKVAVRLASSSNVDVQIRYLDYQVPRKSNFYSRAGHQDKKGLHCQVEKAKGFTWQHFALLESLLTRENLARFNRTHSTLAPIVAHSSKTTMFEAYKGEELVGFIIARESLQNVAIGMWGCFKRGPFEASDFLYRNLIEFYQSKVPILDLGYSVHNSLLQYKLKWRANVTNGPYWDYAYARKDYTLSSKYWHWWARELLPSATLPSETGK